MLEKGYMLSIRMDGKGQILNNIFIECFCRSLKDEEVYINAYKNVLGCKKGIEDYVRFYNYERFHQTLDYLIPLEVYKGQSFMMQVSPETMKIIDSYFHGREEFQATTKMHSIALQSH